MNKEDIVLVFNKQLIDFIKKICLAFPDIEKNPQLVQMKQLWETTIELTPDITVLIDLFWQKIVQPFNDKIKNNDDTFFLNFASDNEHIEFIQTLYIGASIENKQVIWKFVQRFTNLCNLYHSEKI